MIRLLVVEDNDMVRNGLVLTLKGLDYHVRPISIDEVNSAESALELIGRTEASHDLAIVDLKLPGISGYELTRLLSKRAESIPVLINTELDEDVASDFATECGAVGFVTKRMTASQLLNAVHQVLDNGYYLPLK